MGAHESARIGELPLGVPNNLVPFITQTAAGIREKLTIYGNDYDTPDGTNVRDYIHVVDLAKAHVVAVQRLLDRKASDVVETFNVGTGHGNSVLEVVQDLRGSQRPEAELQHRPAPARRRARHLRRRHQGRRGARL
ncbi:MAG: NAD-dependent epimerase/dehydratase family protein [Hymenobacter sp.]